MSRRFFGVLFLGCATLTAQVGTAPNDDFSGTALDSCRWDYRPAVGTTLSVNGALRLQADGTQGTSTAVVASQYQFPADFDVQVDFELGPDWNAPLNVVDSGAHIAGAALRIYFDEQDNALLFRRRDTTSDQIFVYGTVNGTTFVQSRNSYARTGTMRVRRLRTSYEFLANTDGQWASIATWQGPSRAAVIVLQCHSVATRNSVTTTYRNFRINSGVSTYKDYALPNQVRERSDFFGGFVSASHTSQQYWGPRLGYDPFPLLKENGFGLAAIHITTVSSQYLRNMPVSQRSTLPWRDEYWSALEMGEQLLREANQLGMKTYLELYLSDQAAHASRQNAPPEWQGLPVDQTAAKLEDYGYTVASYFKSRGVTIDAYSTGNEIGTGIVNFRPGERLAMPQGASPYNAVRFMRENVWNVEAILLKSLITGIRRADPNARIVLHIAGLSFSYADVFLKGFFQAMSDYGVAYDIAALSNVYPEPGWSPPRYTTACWFQRIDETVRFIAGLGKQAMISEGAYPSTPTNTSAPNEPMPDFPFTPQGQAAWINAALRFATNNPSLFSWVYFYPEWFPGWQQRPPADLDAFGLMDSPTTPRPGLEEFAVLAGKNRLPTIGAAVNAANSSLAPVAPGSLATIYGSNLSGFTSAIGDFPLPVVNSSAQVSVNGTLAPLLYVSPTQVNFQLPYEVSPGNAMVRIRQGLQDSQPYSVSVAVAAPNVFLYNGTHAVAQNQDWSLNGPGNPASPGSAIVVYLTGLGAVTPALGTGAPAGVQPLSFAASPVTATVDGISAKVIFAGLTPYLVGLAQVNLIVPTLATGEHRLVINVGGSLSPETMISIGP